MKIHMTGHPQMIISYMYVPKIQFLGGFAIAPISVTPENPHG